MGALSSKSRAAKRREQAPPPLPHKAAPASDAEEDVRLRHAARLFIVAVFARLVRRWLTTAALRRGRRCSRRRWQSWRRWWWVGGRIRHGCAIRWGSRSAWLQAILCCPHIGACTAARHRILAALVRGACCAAAEQHRLTSMPSLPLRVHCIVLLCVLHCAALCCIVLRFAAMMHNESRTWGLRPYASHNVRGHTCACCHRVRAHALAAAAAWVGARRSWQPLSFAWWSC